MATTDLLHTQRAAARGGAGRPGHALRAALTPLVGLVGVVLVLVGVVAANVGSHAPSALAVDGAWALVGLAAIAWSATARRRRAG